MMLVKNLSGVLLDYWLAKAEGLDARLEVLTVNPPRAVGVTVKRADGKLESYRPTLDRDLALRLIKGVTHIPPDPDCENQLWVCKHPGGPVMYGENGMLAALRARVASVLGYDVPDVKLK
jgi:hypothetical protein